MLLPRVRKEYKKIYDVKISFGKDTIDEVAQFACSSEFGVRDITNMLYTVIDEEGGAFEEGKTVKVSGKTVRGYCM